MRHPPGEGPESFGQPAKRGGQNFLTRPEGGPRSFGRVGKGGILDLNYFFNLPKSNVFQCFYGF